MSGAETEQPMEAAWEGRIAAPGAVEVIGTLVSVSGGKVVLEAKQRFEISVDASPSLSRALGKLVGVVVIDGRVSWRLVKITSGNGKGGRP